MMPLLMWNRKRKLVANLKRKRLSQRIGETIDTWTCDIAPSWGAKRTAARQRRELIQRQVQLFEKLGSSWPGAAASESRDGRYLGTKSSPDDAIEYDLPKLRNRCVELYRGNTVAHSAVEGRVSNEVGIGITRNPRVRHDKGENPKITKENSEAINDELKDVCDRWSDHGVDKRRRLCLSAVQRLVCRTYATYGEAFVILSEAPFTGSVGLSVDVISPERVETPPDFLRDPNVRMGIRYTAGGQIIGYYVRHTHPDEQHRYLVGYKFIRRFDDAGHARMIHVFDPQFPEQSRGIPWLATAMNRAKDVDDFFEAELIAKQIEACFGLVFTGGKESPDPMSIAEGNATAKVGGVRMEEIGPGFVHYSGDGESVSTIDPQRPGSSFAPFIEASLRGVAAALNFPYEILAKNFFRTTFSSGRLAMLDGWMGFAMRQQTLVEQFLRPLWRRLVHDAVFMGLLDGLVDPVDYISRPHVYERHKWVGQGRGFIDPDKEVRAHVRANEAGITTKSIICGEKGQDWEDNEEQIDTEERKKIELRTDREVWENELREARGLQPLVRTYTENIGGAVQSTSDSLDDDSDDEQSQEDRELEVSNT